MATARQCCLALSLLAASVGLAALPSLGQEPSSTDAAQDQAPHATESLRGRIVWMAEALRRRYGIKSSPEAAERVIALESRDGGLHPLVEDLRGEAFRKDERLRKLADVELLVRRHEGSPMVQVIRLYSWEDGRRVELDYWCEICAIAMFQLKPCDCCQGPIELRRRAAPVLDQ